MSAVNTTTNTTTNTTGTGTTPQKSTDKIGKELSSNYTDFLRLLTTQLQHQDPTAPADTNQLTQQIATLSQVEQQIATNDSLKELVALYNSSQSFSAVSYIGKQIETEGNQGVLNAGEAAFVYNLPDAVESVEISIKNAAGNVVYSGAGTTIAGRNQVIWNGKDKDSVDMPPGVYTVSVVAKDSTGKAMEGVTTKTTGIVRSVDTQNGISTLSLGDISVPVDKVLSVRSPSV
jgi:flagellar basal-body rod modification protein FlgD